MTADHRLAATDPPGPASRPPHTPNGVNLAAGRSHLRPSERHILRPRGGLAAAAAAVECAACAPRMPATLPAVTRAAPAAAAVTWRPLHPLHPADRPPQPASSARCDGAAAALRPAATRQTRRGELWATRARGPGSAAAAAAASGRATAVHAATRTHTRRFLRAARTSRERPRRVPEWSAVAAMAAARMSGTWAVGPAPSAAAAAREEVPASAERAPAGVSCGRDGADGARIRALGARHTCWAAEKVAAATARWAEAAAHPPATHRPPLDRSHRMGTVEYDGPAQ